MAVYPQIQISASSGSLGDEQDYYKEHRGPILVIRGVANDRKLFYTDNEGAEGDNALAYICDDSIQHFSTTTRGKDVRTITFHNGGTTAIRYQWLRQRPTKDMQLFLANPGGSLAMEKKRKKKIPLLEEDDDSTDTVVKGRSLEFRLKELPGVLLPGQSLEFPVVFRSLRAGYFYETFYLLTHPMLQDVNGRGYSMKLTGICMDPDLWEGTKAGPDLNDALKHTATSGIAKGIMDSILFSTVFVAPRGQTPIDAACGGEPKDLELVEKESFTVLNEEEDEEEEEEEEDEEQDDEE